MIRTAGERTGISTYVRFLNASRLSLVWKDGVVFEMTCPGHGINIGPYVNALTPDGHCHYCRLPLGTFTPPDVSSTPFAPRLISSVATSASAAGSLSSASTTPRDIREPGVTRNALGHIIGISWDQLGPESAHLLAWKDRPLGPGHPLATSMDPRSFIPGMPRKEIEPPRPTLPSPQPPSCRPPELPALPPRT